MRVQSIRVVSVDVGCDACGAYVCDLPVLIADRWMQPHTRPALLAMNSLLNGRPSRWVRQGRTA